MATPPFIPMAPPPLPLGWSEHIGPNGQPYYFNAHTSESTYTRPLPAFPIQKPPAQPQSKKKDKPLVKTPIPGTDWIRVKTTQGNLFYSHKVDKRSVWIIPDEIKGAVEDLETKEREDEEQMLKQQEEESAGIETERVKAQVLKDTMKRKAEELVPVDELVISKKARVEDEMEGEDGESDDEEWQKEAAAQLAAEQELRQDVEEEDKMQVTEQEPLPAVEAKDEPPPLNMPAKVDLSIEEGKALFKTLLREKDVNPLHPWDVSLPLFISDPRYVLLPSVSARRETFDEYCRDRAREMRQSKVSKEKEDPKEEFEKLLREEVKSTRASWSDFRRQWKKDRRFYGWGRDEREREKKFRTYLKELGEKKWAAAQQAEADFFSLLRASGVAKQGCIWKEVKRKISEDPRYEAVGSSSLREELFSTFLKANESSSSASRGPHEDELASHYSLEDQEQSRRERKERAVREREQKVKSDMSRLEAEIGRSRIGLNKEEDEREFRTLLTDAVRDPQVTWETVAPQLQNDPRFTGSQLPVNQQRHIFHNHVNNLRGKHLTNLHCLFESHAASLAAPFFSLPLASILSSLPASKLGFNENDLRHEYEKWQRERGANARRDFDQMMSENSFVEFWGRLGKIGGKGVDDTIQNDDIGEDDGGEGERVDMKKLAKSVDVKEIVKVLKNDKRYIMFDHVPQQREQWIRDYVSSMTAPQLSVHVPERS